MIGYVTVGTNDLPRAIEFYEKLFGSIGATRVFEGEQGVAWSNGPMSPGFGVMTPFNQQPATFGNGVMIAMVMDSKADDVDLFDEFARQRQMTLITRCRQKMNKTPRRQRMIKTLNKRCYQKLLKERSYKVEPMQALVKDIFDLDRCWMHGNSNNRWVFAAMGVAIQMAQLVAYKNNQSTWKIKQAVLGDP